MQSPPTHGGEPESGSPPLPSPSPPDPGGRGPGPHASTTTRTQHGQARRMVTSRCSCCSRMREDAVLQRPKFARCNTASSRILLQHEHREVTMRRAWPCCVLVVVLACGPGPRPPGSGGDGDGSGGLPDSGSPPCVGGDCMTASCDEAAQTKSYFGCEYWSVDLDN